MSIDSAILRLIDRELRQIEMESRGIVQRYPLKPIPDDLYESIAGAADVIGDAESKMQQIYRSTIMKPTICTFNFNLPFYVNACTKIVRLSLTDEYIEDIIEDLEGRLLALQGMPFNETVDERLEMYRSLFSDDSKIDRFRLGAAEIFGDATYNNLLRDPRACLSLFWIDDSGQARGYQINVITEIVQPGDPFFRYMQVLRSIFSSSFVDSKRRSYVAGYKLWVSDIIDKSLMSKPGFIRD